jgi:ribosomal protein S18 acetylase RimI-like enzyme
MVSEAIRLNEEQLGRTTEVLTRAFEDYPLMTYAIPDKRKRINAVGRLYGGILRYCLHYGEAYVTAALQGAAGWLPPERPFPSFWCMAWSGMITVPFSFGWEGFQRLHAADQVAQQLHWKHGLEAGKHWYLWAIGVDPPDQGMGVARRILQPVLARADQTRCPCYLETHKEANLPIYQRLGFEVVSQVPVPGHPITVWAMLRSPRTAQASSPAT